MVVAPKATTMAEPVSIPVKKLDGSDAGSASLSLKVASDESATHVVHRYLQYFRDGNRAVSLCIISEVMMEKGRNPTSICGKKNNFFSWLLCVRFIFHILSDQP